MRPSRAPLVHRRSFVKGALPAAAWLGGCATPAVVPASGPRRRRAARPLALELRVDPTESLEQALRRARSGGYHTVLVPAREGASAAARTLASLRLSSTRAALETSGCSPLGVHDPLEGLPRGSLVDPDARVDFGALLALREAIELCAAVGGQVVVLGGGAQRSAPAGTPVAEARRRLAKRLLVAAAWAAERRLELLLDALPAEETNVINTAAEAVALVREVAHPALGVALSGQQIDVRAAKEALSGPGRRVKLVRVQGSAAPDDGLLTALDEAGYDGWLSVADGALATAA